jgi:hypothetical protein
MVEIVQKVPKIDRMPCKRVDTMPELTKTQIGTFKSEDSIVAGDLAAGADSGLIFAAKPGIWKIFRLADETHTHELIIIHESVKSFSEERASWIAEPAEVSIVSENCGLFDLQGFQTNKEEIELMFDRKIGTAGYLTTELGCLTKAGYGIGSYNLLLCYNKDGEAIAGKLIFIDEVYDNDFESYEDDKSIDEWAPSLWDEDLDFGEDDDYEEN